MAEIKIEKKKPVWPWILLVLILLAAIYFFWYYNDRNFNSDELLINDTISEMDETYRYDDEIQESRPLYTGTYGTVRNEAALADYLGYVDKRDNNSMDKDYYRMAFFKLITTTKRKAEIKNVDVINNIEAAMTSAEQLTNDPTPNMKADNAKKAADEVSKALKTIQQKGFDNLSDDRKAVEKAVNEINGSQSLGQQSNNLDIFFDKTAKLLQKMYESENNH